MDDEEEAASRGGGSSYLTCLYLKALSYSRKARNPRKKAIFGNGVFHY